MPTSVETVVENIVVVVLNWLSILIMGRSRKVTSYYLRNKSKARLETTFLRMTKARARPTWYMKRRMTMKNKWFEVQF